MKLRLLLLLTALSLAMVPGAEAQSTQRGLAVAPVAIHSNTWGAYHALIIGINDYKEWPRLKTAVKDATVIRDTLVSRYGFDRKNVLLRTDKDASRLQITRDLRYLAQSMGKDDNLFVYYAGHGQLDDFTGDGYWVPAEGTLKDPGTWVANSYIKAILSSERLQAKNVVIIADSCYSGSMLRGGPSLMSLDDQRYREKLAEKSALRSRQVISSGGLEPVADGGAEGHSLFAFYLIDALRKNDREVIDLENLFHTRVWKPVSEIGDQRPNVGRLKTPMDQNGQFVLYNAAWAQEQAARRDAAEAKQQAHSRQKAAVASTELELQRQRFEMEKQQLAMEKEQLAQQKALEVERLKFEKQKQEFEYAKLQARLAAMEAKSKTNDLKAAAKPAATENLQAALDPKALDSRRAARASYKLALFPIQFKALRPDRELTTITRTIRGVAQIADEDDRLEFSLSYKLVENLPGSVQLFKAPADGPEVEIWTKKSLFADPEPNWDYLEKASLELDVDLVLLVKMNAFPGDAFIDVYLYDHKQKKRYSRKKAAFVRGALEDNLNILLKKFYRDQKK